MLHLGASSRAPRFWLVFGRVATIQAAYVLLMCAAIALVPVFRHSKFQTMAKHWPETYEKWQSEFSTWDTAFYLHIVTNGYEQGDASCAFYPGWPYLLRALSELTSLSPLWLGVILANVFFAFAITVLYRYLFETQGASVALWTCALLISFPGALFFHVPYTESMFLLNYALLLFAIRRGAIGMACCCAFLLPLARAVGVFTIVPLCYLCWIRDRRFALPVIACLLGYGTYLLIMQLTTGYAFSGFVAQAQFPNQPSIKNIFDLRSFIYHFLHVDAGHTMLGSPLDRLCFLSFCWVLPWLYKANRLLFWFAVAYGLIPAFSNQFLSYTRFTSINIPVFFAYAAIIPKTLPWCASALAIGFFMQILLLVRHLNFYWAG